MSPPSCVNHSGAAATTPAAQLAAPAVARPVVYRPTPSGEARTGDSDSRPLAFEAARCDWRETGPAGGKHVLAVA